MQKFENDDEGYRTWLYTNIGRGFVVNALRGRNPGEPILHRASCDTIVPTPERTSLTVRRGRAAEEQRTRTTLRDSGRLVVGTVPTRHGARTLHGLRTRLCQRFLALAAAISFNHRSPTTPPETVELLI